MSLLRQTPLVYLISDGSITDENYTAKSSEFLQLVKAAINNHIPLIQIREKEISARCLSDLATAVVDLSRNSRTKVLVNDRLDVAITAGADGVHLTARSAPVDLVRRSAPKEFLIAVSCHSQAELEEARVGGADLAVFGPIYESPGKATPIGLAELKTAVNAEPDFPVVALGGIDETNYRQVLDTGAAGIAAIRFLNNVQNLEKLSDDLGL